MAKRRVSYESNGDYARRLREKHGWSQEELAEKALCGVRTVRSLEKGEKVSAHSLESVARAFGIAHWHALLSEEEKGRLGLANEGNPGADAGVRAGTMDHDHATSQVDQSRFVSEMIALLETMTKGWNYSKSRVADYLDAVASYTATLAYVWSMILERVLQRQRSRNQVVDIRAFSIYFRQHGIYRRVEVVYERMAEILADERHTEFAAQFMNSVDRLMERRQAARRLLDAALEGRSSVEGASESRIKLRALEDAVTVISREAGELRGLATCYRATI
jgi:transcriptional regulator with XRE-family HTH domain